MVQYYHVCERELWFVSRGIDINRETTNIQRGTHVDETSYQEERRSFMIGNRIQASDALRSRSTSRTYSSRFWRIDCSFGW